MHLPCCEEVAEARGRRRTIVGALPPLGPPNGVDKVSSVLLVAKPPGDQGPGRLVSRARGAVARAPPDVHRPLGERRKVVDVLCLLPPGYVDIASLDGISSVTFSTAPLLLEATTSSKPVSSGLRRWTMR